VAGLLITEKSTSELIPYASNSRTHSEEQIAQIAASIKEFGFNNPILLDGDKGVIAGHGRLLAARKLEMDKVPTIELAHLSETKKKAYILADNKLALNAGWNMDLLSLEMGGLQDEGFDLSLIGFNETELADILADRNEGLTDPDAVPDTPDDPVTCEGDVWLLGKHRLMCGDSTSIDAVDTLMAGQKADMVFTDPPYGIDYSGGRTQVVRTKAYGRIKGDTLEGDDLGGLIAHVFSHSKPGADVYICVSPIMQEPFLKAIKENDKQLDAVIVWDKKQPGLGYMAYRRQCEFILFMKGEAFKKGDTSDFDLWQISKDATKEYKHGTQKPVAVPGRAMDNSSKAGDIVLDLFGGSGSTLVAAEMRGRDAHLMEIHPAYCDVAVNRWQDFTGEQATLEGSGEYFPSIKADATQSRKASIQTHRE
jgi:DNA modification methylase